MNRRHTDEILRTFIPTIPALLRGAFIVTGAKRIELYRSQYP